MPALLPRAEHCDLRVGHDALRGLGVGRIQGDADVGAEKDLLAENREGLGERFLEPRDDARRVVGRRDLAQHDGELVAAHSRDRVVFPHALREALAEHLEQAVAGCTPEAFVHPLKALHVEPQYPDQLAGAARSDERALHPVGEQVPVRQPRERIVVGVSLELRLVRLHAGDIVLYPHEVSELSFRGLHREDLELVPEEIPVLAVVAQHDFGLLAFAEADADLLQAGLVGVGALQEAAVVADRLGDGVAGGLLERRVDVDERMIGPSSVRDEDPVHARFDRVRLKVQALLGDFLLRDGLLARRDLAADEVEDRHRENQDAQGEDAESRDRRCGAPRRVGVAQGKEPVFLAVELPDRAADHLHDRRALAALDQALRGGHAASALAGDDAIHEFEFPLDFRLRALQPSLLLGIVGGQFVQRLQHRARLGDRMVVLIDVRLLAGKREAALVRLRGDDGAQELVERAPHLQRVRDPVVRLPYLGDIGIRDRGVEKQDDARGRQACLQASGDRSLHFLSSDKPRRL